MTYATVAEAAARIRAAYKARGWNSRKVSVRSESYSGGSSIRVTLKDAGVPLAEAKKIAEAEEHVRYDSYSGEILSGGNRFVFVEYDPAVIAAVGERLAPAVTKAAAEARASRGTIVPIDGTDLSVSIDGYSEVHLWRDRHVARVWDDDYLPKSVARVVLTRDDSGYEQE